ncbi:MAG: hypothetical protein ACKVJE_00075 [Pseudomonadales bacterium]|jgi:hypothetical protein
MKYILILCAIAAGYYLYTSSAPEVAKGSIVDRIDNGQSVPASDIQKEAKKLVNFFCSDSQILESFGSSISQCLKDFKDNENSCDNRVFPDPNALVSKRNVAKSLITKYRKCTIS